MDAKSDRKRIDFLIRARKRHNGSHSDQNSADYPQRPYKHLFMPEIRFDDFFVILDFLGGAL
ncbi:MAG: hypothetical protein V3V56_10165, partial [bacterium]